VPSTRARDRLDRRLATLRLRPRHARAVAQALAALHVRAEPCRPEEGAGSSAALGARVQEAAAKLGSHASRALPTAALFSLLAEQRRFLVEGIAALLDRLADGRVRPLHGDLACRSVWVGKGRRVRFGEPTPHARGDVAEDIAALALDLRARRGARLAEILAAAYALAADDYGLYRVLDFYERDAACRFALAAAASADPEAGDPEPSAYTQAALAKAGRTRLLIATGGAVASGKSTVAKAIARRIAAPRVVADRVRETLLEPIPDGIVHELIWDRTFSEGFGERVYHGLLRRAEAVLASGRAVVLDACFPDPARRREAAALAERHGARFVFLHCDPAAAEIDERLRKRDARDGAGWFAIASDFAARWQPPGPDEPGPPLRVDTGLPEAEWMAALAPALEAWLVKPAREDTARR
jgi:hypothetical protein